MTTLYQSLAAFGRRVDGPKPYHSQVKLVWQLNITSEGVESSPHLTALTHETVVRGQSATQAGAFFELPRITRSSGASPMLASDDVAYVLGWPDDGVSAPKAAERHDLFVNLTRKWAESDTAADDPVPKALLTFLTSGGPERLVKPESWTAKDGVLVTVDQSHAHLASSVIGFWSTYAAAKKGSGKVGLCLVCGRTGDLVDTLPQNVKGAYAPGGQSSGVAPISINKAPFGFQLETGLGHVPICSTCALAIPTALNTLLGDQNRVHRADGSRTTWWVDGESTFDPMTAVEAPPSDADIKHLLRGIDEGADVSGRIGVDEFHSLTVSGNVARLVIREWYHLPLDSLKSNIGQWFRDTESLPLHGDGRRFLPLWRLAASTGRYDEKAKVYLSPGAPGGRHPHQIVDTLRDAALRAMPVPPSVLAHLIQRIAADQRVDDPRAALLRLILVRSPTLQEAVMPGLDPNSTHAPYVLGRLFAVYEALQLQAAKTGGGAAPNSTFADKNFAGAISSPRLVLSAGARQSSAWLGKLRRTGGDYFFRRDIDEIIDLLGPNALGPARSSLDDQAQFVLGYHHQRASTNRQIAAAVKAKTASKLDSPNVPGDTNDTPIQGDL